MSVTTVAYPLTLPSPSAAPIQSTERRILAPTGPFDARAAQRDRLALQQVTFPPMRAAEAAIFEAWGLTTLIQWGAWFAAGWPLPEGMVIGVRRFMQPPTRAYIPGGLWQYSAPMEVRGRGVLPVNRIAEIWLSSAIYPLLEIDTYGNVSTMTKGDLRVPPMDMASMLAALTSGTLTSILRSYTFWPADTSSETSALVSGTLDTILRSYTFWPPETYKVTSATLVSGTLVNGLISYTYWPAEMTSQTSTLVSGTLA